MIYYGLEKWFVKNCSIIILMVEFGWNFTLLGPCTKLFIEGEKKEKKKEWRRNWKRKKNNKKKEKWKRRMKKECNC